MRTLKTSLVISLAVVFLAACHTEVNVNTNHNANSNTASAPAVIPVTPTGNANGNSNTPGGPGSGSGAAPAAPTNANTAATTATGASTDAATLYSTAAKPSCAGCHGADGKGKPAFKDIPDFTNAAWQAKETDAELIETIKNGHKPMPAYKDKLSDDQVKALVAYVRQFARR